VEARLDGEKGPYDCPIKLFLFGTTVPQDRDVLEAKLKSDRLIGAAELRRTKQEAGNRRMTMGLKAQRTTVGLGRDADFPEPDSMQDLVQASAVVNFRASGDAIKTLAMDEETLSKLPMAEQPASVKSSLLPYQLQVGALIPPGRSPSGWYF
jgi:SWI/SNF-related matrix-associated actin-dependent regulator of chromatin subfamily A3